MGDACYREQQHQQCVFAYESALELKAQPKAVSMSAVHYQLGAGEALRHWSPFFLALV